MTTINIYTVIVFFAIVMMYILFSTFRQAIKDRPKNKIKRQLHKAVGKNTTNAQAKILAELQRAQSEARRKRIRQNMGMFGYHLGRMETATGSNSATLLLSLTGLVFILVIAVGLLIKASAINIVLAILILPILFLFLSYRYLINKFNRNFTNQLPDAIDSIVRASQAGIPVAQSIRSVSMHAANPLGKEFRRIGDSLLLGNDLETVLDEAAIRINLPDFSFFTVCVLLQKETGGSIVEALENLSAIIRNRRDVQLKAKALTAEGRLTGNVIAAIPFVIMALMYFSNPAYIDVLFTSSAGNQLLIIAGVMLVLGLLVIRHLTNLKV